MATKRQIKSSRDTRIIRFRLKRRTIQFVWDQLLFFKIIHRLHGRFWGLASIFGLYVGFFICYLIRPDLLTASSALSEFGNDVRTAPYFAGTMFFTSYALWRWKNYLSRTLQRTRPLLGLLTFAIIGLYLVALMPYNWHEWPYRIHMFGFALAGISIAALVIFDALLSRPVRGKNEHIWRFYKYVAFIFILVGGWITLGSVERIGWYDITLIGEILMIGGFSIWIVVKTYLGEGKRSALANLLKKLLVD